MSQGILTLRTSVPWSHARVRRFDVLASSILELGHSWTNPHKKFGVVAGIPDAVLGEEHPPSRFSGPCLPVGPNSIGSVCLPDCSTNVLHSTKPVNVSGLRSAPRPGRKPQGRESQRGPTSMPDVDGRLASEKVQNDRSGCMRKS